MDDVVGTPLCLTPNLLLGGLQQEAGAAPVVGATWYVAHAAGDGLACHFAAGALASAHYLSADLLVDGDTLAVFVLALQEGEAGPAFQLHYAALNQCQARIRLPLEALRQNRWRYPREGAWLKPLCMGARVDLARVDRLTVTMLRKGDGPVRWCQTAFTATAEEPPPLADPALPAGPLLDEMGQSTLRQWPTKSYTHRQVSARLHSQLHAAGTAHWPGGYSRWGGWTGRCQEGTGFFRTLRARHGDGQRWWLLDPDGHPFWSAGVGCVTVDGGAAYGGLEQALAWLPDPNGPYAPIFSRRAECPGINYLAANLIRAFGPSAWHANWAEIALAELRRLGFNTVGHGSDWPIAHRAGFPYVRSLEPHWPHTPLVYRDFPDVYHPAFASDAAAYAEHLRETADDPALVGYFLMDEPTWAFAAETPAAGMLFSSEGGPARAALAEFLRRRYGDDATLAAAWGMAVTLAEVEQGRWSRPLSPATEEDLADFSAEMVERLFGGLSDACRAVDPNHLNLGARYHTLPPHWAERGMRAFDVFSVHCYGERVPAAELDEISVRLERPVLIGEWHCGALDAGLPGAGAAHVRDQAARAHAFCVYLEHAASQRYCIGAHYAALYDQSALGRFDGECCNIGLLDVCNRPYERLARAARASHERLYEVALGEVQPYDEAPEYLPPLYL